MSKRIKVPNQPKKVIKQIPKNRTAMGKKCAKSEPATVSNKSIKRDWTIVSDNCYGVAYMKALANTKDEPYNSPFFSIFIYAPDYITLLENFSEYMKIKPVSGKSKYKRTTDYPVLLLKGSKGPVEIHYSHEKQSAREAIRKWNERTKRMSKRRSNLFVKMDDRDKFTVELGERFLKLPFPNKVLFVSQKYKKDFAGKKGVVITKDTTQTPIGTQLEKEFPIKG